MQEVARKLEIVPRAFGHVRLRSSALDRSEDWHVEFFGSAGTHS